MADIIKVEGETIAGAHFVEAGESNPWSVNFGLGSPSPELADSLMNSGELANVEVTVDEGSPRQGLARVITGEIFTLVGRTDLEPVTP